MSLIIGSITLGLLLSLLAFGVFISFRVLNLPDITVEGSVTFGAAVAVSAITAGVSPVLSTLLAFFAGAIAGLVTGLFYTKLKINALLAGILTMTALYSVNLHVMGKSNLPVISEVTILSWCEDLAVRYFPNHLILDILGWQIPIREMAVLIVSIIICLVFGFGLYWFLYTEIGSALRATGNNPQMIRAMGADTDFYTIMGLALSNGLVALSGALLAQYQGFADVQMGIGMLVLGLASVIIGESVVGRKTIGFLITGTIFGSVIFRLLVAIALKWGMNPNDLKLITSVFVLSALIIPGGLRRLNFKYSR